MKKSILFTLVLSLFFTSSLSAKAECVFDGKINGFKSKTLKCTIEKAGSRPYLLATIKAGKKAYMIDLSGISKNTGKRKMYLSVMEYKGRKINRTYKANGKLTIKKPAKYPDVRYIYLNADLISGKKKKLRMNGTFSWITSKLPDEARKGSISQKFGSVFCKESSAKLGIWNDGFQIEKMFIVKPGETANTNLLFPSKKPGTYSGKGVSIRIFYMKMENGKMKSDIMKSKSLKVVVKNNGEKIRIDYKGILESKKGSVPVSGYYQE